MYDCHAKKREMSSSLYRKQKINNFRTELHEADSDSMGTYQNIPIQNIISTDNRMLLYINENKIAAAFLI